MADRVRPRRPGAVLVALGLLAWIGCNQPTATLTERAEELEERFASSSLDSEHDVQRAISAAAAAERAVMFIHVDWAPMEMQRSLFAQFAIEHRQSCPNDELTYHYIDCTPVTIGYEPLENLEGWRKLQRAAGIQLVHGRGEVAWLERGRVLHVEPILDLESSAELVKKTQTLFSSSNDR